ncbi:MAG: hypothetical protein ACMG55_19015, partial [Microcoleus sp.]
ILGAFSDVSETAKEYRELEENRVYMCRQEHEKLHRKQPPKRPSQNVMREAVLRSKFAALSLRGEIYFETLI